MILQYDYKSLTTSSVTTSYRSESHLSLKVEELMFHLKLIHLDNILFYS